MKCVCDGRYAGCNHGPRCGAEVNDSRWGPWCADCNPRRFAHIDAAFAALSPSLLERVIVPDAEKEGT